MSKKTRFKSQETNESSGSEIIRPFFNPDGFFDEKRLSIPVVFSLTTAESRNMLVVPLDMFLLPGLHKIRLTTFVNELSSPSPSCTNFVPHLR